MYATSLRQMNSS